MEVELNLRAKRPWDYSTGTENAQLKFKRLLGKPVSIASVSAVLLVDQAPVVQGKGNAFQWI